MFSLYIQKRANIKDDILSGLTVALALVPEAVAFSFVAGVQPLVGLYAAFIVGIITAVVGGRPGMISGATGALAVIMIELVAKHGVEYLFAAVVLMGIIQITAGILRLGKFIRLIPHPVMLGFVNGLAIVIFLSQLRHFKIPGESGVLIWMGGTALWMMLGLVGITMAVIHFLPRITRAVPAPLIAILVITVAVTGFNIDTLKVSDMASVGGGLPQFHIPMIPLTWETLVIILPYSLILAVVGLLESLMTLSLVDEITETRGNGNRECFGQGIANVVSGFFGTMGGCAMIGQSMINVNSGGRGRLSGISAAVFLLMCILFASRFIEMIPLAALVGVMFMVVVSTFEWSSFRILHKMPRADAFVLVLVSGVTVFTDLAIAVAAGVVVSALVFAWKSGKNIRIDSHVSARGVSVYSLTGPLFFGSVRKFLEYFEPHKDQENVVIDFKHSRVCDQSGLEALKSLSERYFSHGKRLHLKHLSTECQRFLKSMENFVVINIIEKPQLHVMPGSGRKPMLAPHLKKQQKENYF
ncbi:MAG: SulP family inorganic anion transporter [Candidatus Kuenenia sp.]|nr:SulP family inorganic anion transporter [Candidatus Kuenenia hertensis]